MNTQNCPTSKMSDSDCWIEIFSLYEKHTIGEKTMALLENNVGSPQSKLRVLRRVISSIEKNGVDN
ncbi:hypothetical protein MNBD_CPR01-124 [hydrothermal vent metagenome]|uniref:Uncharacterized protein n=1 Tax=hydrothermal vent metagenome TaxID=652676 RepID=A0A3B0VKD4_9ZZZZ